MPLDGAFGCAASHIQCLEMAIKNGWDHVLIAEDDVHFKNKALLKSSINNIFNSQIEWDVLLLGGLNFKPWIKKHANCLQVLNCETTTCYLVKQNYFLRLLENFRTGLKLLIESQDVNFSKENNTNKKQLTFGKNPYFEEYNFHEYAIDMYWKRLQRKDMWLLVKPLVVVQFTKFESDVNDGPSVAGTHMTVMSNIKRPKPDNCSCEDCREN